MGDQLFATKDNKVSAQRTLLRAVLCGLLASVLAGCAQHSVQGATASATKAACEELVLDYAYYRDRKDATKAADGVAAVFTEDASLTVLGQTFTGKTAIYNRIAQQTNAPLTQHLMSTIRIFPQSASTATGVSYATVYVAPVPADGEPLVEGFAAIGEYHDKFELTANGWRIAQRDFVLRMRYQDGE